MLDRFLAQRRRSPGGWELTCALDLYREPVFDRARSERLFLDLVKKAGLPRPAITTRRAFEADRVRTEDMKLAGIDVVRITARRIERSPREVAQRLRLHLARRRTELAA